MSKRSSSQNQAEYLATRLVLTAIETLPRNASIAAGVRIGRLAYRLASGLRATGERNLQLAYPEKSQAERDRILRASFESLGRLLAEFSRFDNHTTQSISEIAEYDKAGLARVLAARKSGRGVIFLTLHLGAWELLSFTHSVLHEPLAFMVRRLDNPLLEKFVNRRRTRYGNETIDKKDAVRRALKVLREGGTLGILADLNTQPQEGVFVPFFGIPACTTAGVALFALRTNAIIIPVCAPFHAMEGKYVLQAQPPIEFTRTGDNEIDIIEITRLCTAALERFVRRYPEQWLWIHKRWRTRPDNEPDFYQTAPRNMAKRNTISTPVITKSS